MNARYADRMQNIDAYLSGQALYGDDFDASQVARWHADEREGYAALGAADRGRYKYAYHAWNRRHAFRHLPPGKFGNALGFGAAYGDEFQPLASRIEAITIVDPSAAFRQDTVCGIPARYIAPASDGRLELADGSFDLITAIGVLHHIPNVSFVVRELARTLAPGGHLIIREPIVSMGDWRKPRPHLTRHERGIPLGILQSIVRGTGLDLVRTTLCGFAPVQKAFALFRDDPYNSPLAAWTDALACRLVSWNLHYHARTLFQKLRPTSAFLVARKP
ncbi:MAG TPA: class I SAM-dependent methyltransferase [Steroidobacteraceae bacterium]|nr:class I SAM-dependent methyltransferase [Steroidobacteraceae bacterium]